MVAAVILMKKLRNGRVTSAFATTEMGPKKESGVLFTAVHVILNVRLTFYPTMTTLTTTSSTESKRYIII